MIDRFICLKVANKYYKKKKKKERKKENVHQTIFTTDRKTLPFGRDRRLKILIISKDSTCTQEKNTLTCIIVFSQVKRNILTILVWHNQLSFILPIKTI